MSQDANWQGEQYITYKDRDAYSAICVDYTGVNDTIIEDNLSRTVWMPHRSDEAQLGRLNGVIFRERETCLEEPAFTVNTVHKTHHMEHERREHLLQSVRWAEMSDLIQSHVIAEYTSWNAPNDHDFPFVQIAVVDETFQT